MLEMGSKEDPYPKIAQCALCDGWFDVDMDTVELAADDKHVCPSLCFVKIKAGPKRMVGTLEVEFASVTGCVVFAAL